MDSTRITVLVIDDNADNLITVCALLREAFPDMVLLTALSGEWGLELAATKNPDIILLDIVMSGMDGFEVCSALKANPALHDTPVVFVTALKVDKASRIRALECGAEGFLSKPIDEIELTAVVRAMLKINLLSTLKRDEHERLTAMVQEQTRELHATHKTTLNLLQAVRSENDAWRKSEEALRASEEKFRSMVETIPLAIYLTVGGEQTSEYLNPTFLSLFGYTLTDLPTLAHWWLLAYPDEEYRAEIAAEWSRHLQRAIETHTPIQPIEVVVTCKDGSKKDISWDYVTIGEKSYLCGLDLTERKRAEEATIAAKVRAENSEKLKDIFIANISHEVRTPLNIILGFTKVIEEMHLPTASEADRHIFESVERGGERLMRTVDMILNISRLQAGEFPLKPVDVNIPQLVRGVVADMQPFALRRNLSLTSVDECGNVTVVADEYCIVQAVSNLVNNAIKFTAKGGVELRIFHDPQKQLCVSCRDTGIGIAKEYLPVLFTRYSQEQSGYTRPFDGLGLGTALIQEYLMINNASIAVESEKGVGSTFTITFQKNGKLHAQTAPGFSARSRAAPRAKTESTPRHQGRRSVLLIEDDRMTIDFMKLVLAAHWDVAVARSGPEAWVILRTTSVDIILMDISLAGDQTGVELTREIRSSPEHCALPIIAVTAHAYDSDRGNCLAAGCDEFLRKPVNTDALTTTMERLLAR